MLVLTATEKTHPTCDYSSCHKEGVQATYESKYDISGTFSKRCCVNFKWERQKIYSAVTFAVVAYCVCGIVESYYLSVKVI